MVHLYLLRLVAAVGSIMFVFVISGNPDGMEITQDGILFFTGPGGVLVLTPEGKHLGTILTNKLTGNVGFGGDGYLYMAADDTLQRVKVSARPVCPRAPACW